MKKVSLIFAATIIASLSVKAQRPQPISIPMQDIRDIDSINLAGVPANTLVIQNYNVSGNTVTVSSFLGYKVANRGTRLALNLLQETFVLPDTLTVGNTIGYIEKQIATKHGVHLKP